MGAERWVGACSQGRKGPQARVDMVRSKVAWDGAGRVSRVI